MVVVTACIHLNRSPRMKSRRLICRILHASLRRPHLAETPWEGSSHLPQQAPDLLRHSRNVLTTLLLTNEL